MTFGKSRLSNKPPGRPSSRKNLLRGEVPRMAHIRTGHFLDELRATFADRSRETALAFRDETCTFGQLENRAERCAAWLTGHGTGPGERVVLATAEKRPFLAAHLGAIFAGAI